MQIIRPLSDLQNYDKISKLCKESGEPIFLEENGKITLVIMDIELYNKLKLNLKHDLTLN